MWSPKSVNKIFLWQQHKPKILVARWEILVTIFVLRIRTKRTPLGPQRRFFRQKIRLNTNTLIIYTPTSTENPRLRNRMPTIMIYTVLCDCQNFKVNFVPSLISNFWKEMYPTETLLFGSLLHV